MEIHHRMGRIYCEKFIKNDEVSRELLVRCVHFLHPIKHCI